MRFLYRDVLEMDVGTIELVARVCRRACRIEECLELRVKDIEFDRQEIVVRHLALAGIQGGPRHLDRAKLLRS